MAAAPKTRKVRVQNLQPGMKVERIDADLHFVYVEVERIEPQRVFEQTYPRSVTKSYKVYLAVPDDLAPEYRPFTLRPTQSVTILDEEA